uniref:Uncharacterized protein n=1 Tax=Rhipicephalus zambeziensis TaxID=60191 RepID=A0A224YAG4_9ACAR
MALTGLTRCNMKHAVGQVLIHISNVLGVGRFFALGGRRAACFLRLSCCVQLERSCVSILFPSLYTPWRCRSVSFIFVCVFFFPVAYACVAPVALMCVLMTMLRAIVAAIAAADESDYVLMMVMLW